MSLSGNTGLIIYVCVVLFMFGTVFGSFINCAAGRIVAGKDWIRGKSVCENCGHELGVLDLVPVFSYLFLKGECRYCHAKISPRYMLTELFMGICFVWMFLDTKMLNYELFRNLALCVILMGLSLVDLDSYIIPDGFIIAGIVNWLVSILFVSDRWNYFKSGIIGGLSIAGTILIISLIMDHVLKKESLGGGDIKLLFMICLYTGTLQGFILLFVSCLIGLLFVILLKEDKIPFGPSISMATFIILLYGQDILKWYLSLF